MQSNSLVKVFSEEKYDFSSSSSIYDAKFSQGDIPMEYWDQVSRKPQDLNGTWQVMLDVSDSIDGIMKALGYGIAKRHIMATYASVVDIIVTDTDCDKDSSKMGNFPTITLKTSLPLSQAKKATVKYNCQYVTLHDSELGDWETMGYFIDGRAIQRREGKGGLMFDTRVVFHNINDSKIIKCSTGATVQLFRWTYIPSSTGIPLVSNRWLKKLN